MSTAHKSILDDSESHVNVYNEEPWLNEIFWRGHHDWLKSKGYLLHPRYHIDWAPSWTGSTKGSFKFEDCQTKGPLVSALFLNFELSHPPSVSQELEIGRLVSSRDMRSDPRNHCVPIYYDTLELPEATDKGRSCIVVMPYLVDWDRLESQTVGEIVDFCSQIFEGLQFLHNHNVAHYDAKVNNIMIDRSPLYPLPPHFCDGSKRMD
ncbi:hypothetical protein EV360DRAFT_41939 [Lentinula raphanica]|nr:hypothetical protein EV360DRAFT_41939 [Lentinula raphanica]